MVTRSRGVGNPGWGGRRVVVVVVVVFALATTACMPVAPLADTHPSAHALAGALLDALQRRDRDALGRMALSEREFRDHVWPALPAARPERNLPFSYVWTDLRQKSGAALSETLVRHGGRRYELVDTVFGGTTDFGSYRVYRDVALRVRDASGVLRTVRVCGSMIEDDGRWKVFSYIVDEPEDE